LDQIQHIISKS